VNNFENEKGDIADIMCKVRVEAACDYTIKIHNRRHPAVEKKLANRYKLIILLLQLERSDKFCLCANGPKVFWGFFLGGGGMLLFSLLLMFAKIYAGKSVFDV